MPVVFNSWKPIAASRRKKDIFLMNCVVVVGQDSPRFSQDLPFVDDCQGKLLFASDFAGYFHNTRQAIFVLHREVSIPGNNTKG